MFERKKQPFKLESKFAPAGDQPEAIKDLVKGIKTGKDFQTLLGVTGSGKTFTMANVIEKIQKPTLVIAHNKTLAAQLAQEFKEFFPNNAVHYFVSYYDYYQPEAYLPITDTFIEKDAQINSEIDRLRHASTQSLLTRNDVIICASVSCIYGLGSPQEYRDMHVILNTGDRITKRGLFESLVDIHFERTTADLEPGKFRSVGNRIEIMPMNKKLTYQVTLSGSRIGQILEINPITSEIVTERQQLFIFPAKHFITNGDKKDRALGLIEKEAKDRVTHFEKEGKLLEAQRIERRTRYDLALMREMGYCSGIENYSRHLSGKTEGEPPETLLSYFPKKEDGTADFLTFIDESHVTVSQIGGMYPADRARKVNLVEHGFRLPSAKDNRPLQAPEFWERVDQTVFVSATPGKREAAFTDTVVEQIIRPTGLIDPLISVFPVTAETEAENPDEKKRYKGQIQHLIDDAEAEIKKGNRVLATTLTKKMSEDLSEYLKERGMKTEYLHSDVETIDRIEILTRLRRGEIDCLVGVNLLREGLDLPEVTLVAILDADKAGFLRSETSLIQTIGRAARNVNGRVSLYADGATDSMKYAISETNRRRGIQQEYNKKHGITPTTIIKEIKDITDQLRSGHDKTVLNELDIDLAAFGGNTRKLIKFKRSQMEEAVKELDFETAAIIRDEIKILKDIIDKEDKVKEKIKRDTEKKEKNKSKNSRLRGEKKTR